MEKKKIFIELGANNGTWMPDDVLESSDYIIHMFEPNPMHQKRLLHAVAHAKHNNVIYHEKMVWNKNCRKTLYLGNKYKRQGTSVFKKKHVFLDKYTFECEAIDFSQWIIDNLDKDDYIYMNMDIEGSEYYVLDKMIKDGTLDYIDRINLEFHASKIFDKKFKKEFFKLEQKIRSRIDELGIDCHYHGH